MTNEGKGKDKYIFDLLAYHSNESAGRMGGEAARRPWPLAKPLDPNESCRSMFRLISSKKRLPFPTASSKTPGKTYFLQKPSVPLVMTTQSVSFSRPFTPVSVPETALMVSVLPLRTNSISSPFAVPS